MNDDVVFYFTFTSGSNCYIFKMEKNVYIYKKIHYKALNPKDPDKLSLSE